MKIQFSFFAALALMSCSNYHNVKDKNGSGGSLPPSPNPDWDDSHDKPKNKQLLVVNGKNCELTIDLKEYKLKRADVDLKPCEKTIIFGGTINYDEVLIIVNARNMEARGSIVNLGTLSLSGQNETERGLYKARVSKDGFAIDSVGQLTIKNVNFDTEFNVVQLRNQETGVISASELENIVIERSRMGFRIEGPDSAAATRDYEDKSPLKLKNILIKKTAIGVSFGFPFSLDGITFDGSGTQVPQYNVYSTESLYRGSRAVLSSPVPVRFTSGLTMDYYSALSIAAGTVLKFDSDRGIIATCATLKIDGTSEKPVTLTSILDGSVGGDTNGDGGANKPNRRSWKGFQFQSELLAENGCRATLNARHMNLKHGGIWLSDSDANISDSRLTSGDLMTYNQHYYEAQMEASYSSKVKLERVAFVDYSKAALVMHCRYESSAAVVDAVDVTFEGANPSVYVDAHNTPGYCKTTGLPTANFVLWR